MSRRISLEAVPDHNPLEEEGFSLCRVSLSSGQITCEQTLKNIVRLCGTNIIGLMARDDFDPEFLQKIDQNVPIMKGYPTGWRHNQWNPASPEAQSNGMPHIHPNVNCVVAPLPTKTPTAFFNHDIVRAETEKIQHDERYPQEIRKKLRGILRATKNAQKRSALYRSLCDWAKTFVDGPYLLPFIQDLQRRVHKAGGMFEVGYGEHENAAVIDPPFAGHGRSMLRSRMRKDTRTVWKYFGPEEQELLIGQQSDD